MQGLKDHCFRFASYKLVNGLENLLISSLLGVRKLLFFTIAARFEVSVTS